MDILQIIDNVLAMKKFIATAKKQGSSIGLVPTMGSLHDGHLSLVKKAQEECDVVVISIFVNPTQFGPNEDFEAYPREFGADCAKLQALGVDAVFHPSVEEMYPCGYATFVDVESEITNKLCGAKRPGHFRGVATVVTKLFGIVQPDKAFFGQKDAQQVVVIKRMVTDLNLNVEIEMVPIIRSDEGLALSSRNQYLSVAEKKAALILSQSLTLAKNKIAEGIFEVDVLKNIIKDNIMTEPSAVIDYIEIYSFPDLQAVKNVTGQIIIALAVKFGATRLIDNIIVEA